MKKRLCLFMVSMLLFISAGCSQVTPQRPQLPTMETSMAAVDSTTAVEPNDEGSLNTDTGGAEGGSLSGNAHDGLLPDSTEDSSLPGNAEGNSFPDSTADFNDNGLNIDESDSPTLLEDGTYTSKDDVALYLHLYGHLPPNFITKKEAEALGWHGGSLEPYAPGKCIGGSYFGNYEGLLPQQEGRSYTECDIDTLGADSRGAKRIVFSNDGLIYYTEDHYKSFELLYGEDDP